MNLMRMVFAGVLATTAVVAQGAPLEFFVSPTGDDANAGTRAAPFRTPQAAMAAVKRAKASDWKTSFSGAVVTFEDGTYVFEEPMELDNFCSGRKGAPVVWRAEHRGKAVFSGAAALDWTRDGRFLKATIGGTDEIPGFLGGFSGHDGKLITKPDRSYMFFTPDGERLPNSRWPNDGYAAVGEMVGGPVKPDSAGAHYLSGVFKFDSPRMKAWKEEKDLWAFGLWWVEWADTTVTVTNIDLVAKQIAVDRTYLPFGMAPGGKFRIRNAVCEIDEPGEWAVDRKARTVTILPKGEGLPVFAKGTGFVYGRCLTDFVFDGFVFEYNRGSALRFEGSYDVNVRSCVIRHTGGWGVHAKNCRGVRVEGCDLYDLGEGGIHLDGGDRVTLKPGGNVADNNHIHHYGQVVPNYRQGVSLRGVGNRATHNLIHHTVHQAIEFYGNDHYIGYNVCHDCCQYNNDAGTIYCCQRDWTRRGTVIEHNIIHMTGKQPRGTHTEGVYLDDASSGNVVRWNFINRATQGCYIGGGNDNDVSENVIINTDTSVGYGSRGILSPWKGYVKPGKGGPLYKRLTGNKAAMTDPAWRAKYPLMLKVLDFEDPIRAYDAMWNRVTNNLFVGTGPLEKTDWERVKDTATVADNHEFADDPGFVDYYGLNWNFRPGSPADRLLGGKLKFDEIGLYDSPLRVSPAVKFGEGVTKPRPFGPEGVAPSATVMMMLWPRAIPAGFSCVATNLVLCGQPSWGKGAVITLGKGTDASFTEWEERSFGFTPLFDCTLELTLMGSGRVRTFYDDIRVEGAAFANGSFEDGLSGWTVAKWGAPKAPVGVIGPTYGISPATGSKMAAAYDAYRIVQRIQVKRGVPVTVSFKCRAGLPADGVIPPADDALTRFWRENEGKALTRLPASVVPLNSFLSFATHDYTNATPFTESVNMYRFLGEKTGVNFVTHTLRCVPDLSDKATEDGVRQVCAEAHKYGIEVGMDVDVRIARFEFLRRWPDEAQRKLVVDSAPATDGVARVAIPWARHRDHMCYGARACYDATSSRLVEAFAARRDAAGALDPATVRPVAADAVCGTNGVFVTAKGLADGETLFALAEFRMLSADVFSERLMPFVHELMERYRKLGADSAMHDEWGFPPTLDDMNAHRAIWYSPAFARAYSQMTVGRDLAKDCVLMAYPTKGADAARSAAIDAYNRLVYERNAEIEHDFYTATKRIFGRDCYVTKHATWSSQPHDSEFYHNGLDWWAATRDYAQGDESCQVSCLGGMAKKFGGHVWLNEGYGRSAAHYARAAWCYALAGGRMVFHGIYGTKCPTLAGLPPAERRFRGQADIWLQPGFRTGQQRINLLDAITRGQLDAPVALVFGHFRLMNWADPTYEDWGKKVDHALGAAGYYCDAYPSSEIARQTFRIDHEGFVWVGRQRYRAICFHRLSEEDRAVWKSYVSTRREKMQTRIFTEETPVADIIAYLDSVGATRQTPYGKFGLAGDWWDMNRLPDPDGTLTLTDGTVARMRGMNPDAEGGSIVGTLKTPRGSAAFDATGLCAVRFDANGFLEAAAGCIKRLQTKDFSFEYGGGVDIALLRVDGEWRGLWVTEDLDAPVPERLQAITKKWIRLRGYGSR